MGINAVKLMQAEEPQVQQHKRESIETMQGTVRKPGSGRQWWEKRTGRHGGGALWLLG